MDTFNCGPMLEALHPIGRNSRRSQQGTQPLLVMTKINRKNEELTVSIARALHWRTWAPPKSRRYACLFLAARCETGMLVHRRPIRGGCEKVSTKNC